MEIKETVQKLLQEMVVPDLSKIRDENTKILAILEVTNKRLDDVNTHMADQSRRIDETNKRIDETNKRIDEVRSELGQKIDEVRSELGQRIDEIHSDLVNRLDANNARIDRFFETTVTKYEHGKMDERVARLERGMEVLRRQIAA
jgi:DNA anti-recombination protein RmuC